MFKLSGWFNVFVCNQRDLQSHMCYKKIYFDSQSSCAKKSLFFSHFFNVKRKETTTTTTVQIIKHL